MAKHEDAPREGPKEVADAAPSKGPAAAADAKKNTDGIGDNDNDIKGHPQKAREDNDGPVTKANDDGNDRKPASPAATNGEKRAAEGSAPRPLPPPAPSTTEPAAPSPPSSAPELGADEVASASASEAKKERVAGADADGKRKVEAAAAVPARPPPPPPRFEINDVVDVESRTWAGINKPGGVARIVAVHFCGDGGDNDGDGNAHPKEEEGRGREGGQEVKERSMVTYDVAYVLGGKEKGVKDEFLSLAERDVRGDRRAKFLTPVGKEEEAADRDGDGKSSAVAEEEEEDRPSDDASSNASSGGSGRPSRASALAARNYLQKVMRHPFGDVEEAAKNGLYQPKHEGEQEDPDEDDDGTNGATREGEGEGGLKIASPNGTGPSSSSSSGVRSPRSTSSSAGGRSPRGGTKKSGDSSGDNPKTPPRRSSSFKSDRSGGASTSSRKKRASSDGRRSSDEGGNRQHPRIVSLSDSDVGWSDEDSVLSAVARKLKRQDSAGSGRGGRRKSGDSDGKSRSSMGDRNPQDFDCMDDGLLLEEDDVRDDDGHNDAASSVGSESVSGSESEPDDDDDNKSVGSAVVREEGEGEGINPDFIADGSRVLVEYRGTLYRATVLGERRVSRDGRTFEFRIHYDGHKKSKTLWVPLDKIKEFLDEEFVAQLEREKTKERKREQLRQRKRKRDRKSSTTPGRKRKEATTTGGRRPGRPRSPQPRSPGGRFLSKNKKPSTSVASASKTKSTAVAKKKRKRDEIPQEKFPMGTELYVEYRSVYYLATLRESRVAAKKVCGGAGGGARTVLEYKVHYAGYKKTSDTWVAEKRLHEINDQTTELFNAQREPVVGGMSASRRGGRKSAGGGGRRRKDLVPPAEKVVHPAEEEEMDAAAVEATAPPSPKKRRKHLDLSEISPGVEFLPGSCVFVLWHDVLYLAKMLKRRSTRDGTSVEYRVHYNGFRDSYDAWVSVRDVYEINPRTRRIFDSEHMEKHRYKPEGRREGSGGGGGSGSSSDRSTARGGEDSAAGPARSDDASRKRPNPGTSSSHSPVAKLSLSDAEGLTPGVEFLPGSTLFATKDGRLQLAKMLKRRGEGVHREYYVQYLNVKRNNEAWVKVGDVFEINPQTKRVFNKQKKTR